MTGEDEIAQDKPGTIFEELYQESLITEKLTTSELHKVQYKVHLQKTKIDPTFKGLKNVKSIIENQKSQKDQPNNDESSIKDDTSITSDKSNTATIDQPLNDVKDNPEVQNNNINQDKIAKNKNKTSTTYPSKNVSNLKKASNMSKTNYNNNFKIPSRQKPRAARSSLQPKSMNFNSRSLTTHRSLTNITMNATKKMKDEATKRALLINKKNDLQMEINQINKKHKAEIAALKKEIEKLTEENIKLNKYSSIVGPTIDPQYTNQIHQEYSELNFDYLQNIVDIRQNTHQSYEDEVDTLKRINEALFAEYEKKFPGQTSLRNFNMNKKNNANDDEYYYYTSSDSESTSYSASVGSHNDYFTASSIDHQKHNEINIKQKDEDEKKTENEKANIEKDEKKNEEEQSEEEKTNVNNEEGNAKNPNEEEKITNNNEEEEEKANTQTEEEKANTQTEEEKANTQTEEEKANTQTEEENAKVQNNDQNEEKKNEEEQAKNQNEKEKTNIMIEEDNGDDNEMQKEKQKTEIEENENQKETAKSTESKNQKQILTHSSYYSSNSSSNDIKLVSNENNKITNSNSSSSSELRTKTIKKDLNKNIINDFSNAFSKIKPRSNSMGNLRSKDYNEDEENNVVNNNFSNDDNNNSNFSNKSSNSNRYVNSDYQDLGPEYEQGFQDFDDKIQSLPHESSEENERNDQNKVKFNEKTKINNTYSDEVSSDFKPDKKVTIPNSSSNLKSDNDSDFAVKFAKTKSSKIGESSFSGIDIMDVKLPTLEVTSNPSSTSNERFNKHRYAFNMTDDEYSSEYLRNKLKKSEKEKLEKMMMNYEEEEEEKVEEINNKFKEEEEKKKKKRKRRKNIQDRNLQSFVIDDVQKYVEDDTKRLKNEITNLKYQSFVANAQKVAKRKEVIDSISVKAKSNKELEVSAEIIRLQNRDLVEKIKKIEGFIQDEEELIQRFIALQTQTIRNPTAEANAALQTRLSLIQKDSKKIASINERKSVKKTASSHRNSNGGRSIRSKEKRSLKLYDVSEKARETFMQLEKVRANFNDTIEKARYLLDDLEKNEEICSQKSDNFLTNASEDSAFYVRVTIENDRIESELKNVEEEALRISRRFGGVPSGRGTRRALLSLKRTMITLVNRNQARANEALQKYAEQILANKESLENEEIENSDKNILNESSNKNDDKNNENVNKNANNENENASNDDKNKNANNENENASNDDKNKNENNENESNDDKNKNENNENESNDDENENVNNENKNKNVNNENENASNDDENVNNENESANNENEDASNDDENTIDQANNKNEDKNDNAEENNNEVGGNENINNNEDSENFSNDNNANNSEDIIEEEEEEN